jgi:hypothetical protein
MKFSCPKLRGERNVPSLSLPVLLLRNWRSFQVFQPLLCTGIFGVELQHFVIIFFCFVQLLQLMVGLREQQREAYAIRRNYNLPAKRKELSLLTILTFFALHQRHSSTQEFYFARPKDTRLERLFFIAFLFITNALRKT